MAEYAYPEVLVGTEWVAQHRHDPTIRIVESDEDILLYDVGHIPGAIKVDWQNELQHQVIRDYSYSCWSLGSRWHSNDRHVEPPHYPAWPIPLQWEPRGATPARALMRFERNPSEALAHTCRLEFPASTLAVA